MKRTPGGRPPLSVRLASAALLGLLLAAPGALRAGESEDLAAARALFEANLEAIRDRDRDAYLACYLESDKLARTGATGFSLGYEELAASAGEGWPDLFEGRDLQLVAVSPGVVYGTYRYRVRYGDDEQSGLSERLFVATPDGWRIAVTTAFQAPPGTPPPPLALTGATLVDGSGAPPVADAVVVLRNGLVDCAGTSAECAVPEGVERLDLTGRWITPGLIDTHVHFAQTGWADGRPDFLDVRQSWPYDETVAGLETAPERFFRAWLCSGVTAVFDVGGYPWTWGLRRPAEADTRAPHVAAAGPLLSTLDFWLNLPAERQFIHLHDEASAAAGVAYLAANRSDAAKVWFIVRPDDDFAALAAAVRAAGAEAEKAGLPLIVHATGLREARVAVAAGAHLLVHGVWDQPVDDEFVALLREKGTIYAPTLTVMDGYRRLAEAAAAGEAPAIDDPHGCVDAATRGRLAATGALDPALVESIDLPRLAGRVAERRRVSAANVARLAAADLPIALGTDAGNPLTLHGPSVYAELEAMHEAGMTPMQVLVAATRNGARALGREAELGTLEAGKAADLVVLDADPLADVANWRRLSRVVRGGVVRTVGELAASP